MNNGFSPYQTATLLDTEECFCKDCGWPIVDLCCNGDLALKEPYDEWDWWMYCSNPVCKNHAGHGISVGVECSFLQYKKQP